MDTAQMYREWRVPYIEVGSGKLVARAHAPRVIELIYRDGYEFLGYDPFTVFPDGLRQPHMDFSASFSSERQPTLEKALESMNDDPAEISHYEFVFLPRA